MKIVNWKWVYYMGNQINYIIWIYNKLSLIVNHMMGVFVMYIFIRIRVFRVIFRVQIIFSLIIIIQYKCNNRPFHLFVISFFS